MLWNIFRRTRRKPGSEEANNKYKELDDQPQTVSKKRVLLEMALVGGDGANWEDHVISYTEKYTDSRSRGTKLRWLYYGELEKEHGKRETKTLTTKGTYKQEQNKDGTIQYRKFTDEEDYARRRERIASVSKSRDAEPEECDNLSKAFLHSFEAQGEEPERDYGRMATLSLTPPPPHRQPEEKQLKDAEDEDEEGGDKNKDEEDSEDAEEEEEEDPEEEEPDA